jgi:hypothetical protein
MHKTSLIGRLLAFSASITITLVVVTALAQYGLPGDGGTQLMAQATPAMVE